MAPVNIAGQPILLVRQLQKMGVDASLVQFVQGSGAANKFGYETDRVVMMTPTTRPEVQLSTLGELLDEGTDIFHFWLRSGFYGRPYKDLQGLDLPIIKAHGRKVLYRFTGFDLRLRSDHERVNPYNPFQYGYDHGLDEAMQRRYLAWLGQYVDQFVVQDPEMGEFMPSASIIPRSMDMGRWDPVGVDPSNKRPLVIHSPSKTEVKGTRFVLEAVETLRSEGLDFDFRLIQDMKHEDAIELYKQCDIAVDQLLIGWYGVFSLEAMALAKPTIVYVRDEPLAKLGLDLPIQNANPDTITDRLRELILDGARRKELGERGRAFVEEYHSVEKVATALVALYEDVLAQPTMVPQQPAAPAMEYMAHQVMERQKELLDGIKSRKALRDARAIGGGVRPRDLRIAEKRQANAEASLDVARQRLDRTRELLAANQAELADARQALATAEQTIAAATLHAEKLTIENRRVNEVASTRHRDKTAKLNKRLAAAQRQNRELANAKAELEQERREHARVRRDASLPRKAALKFFNEGASGLAQSVKRRVDR